MRRLPLLLAVAVVLAGCDMPLLRAPPPPLGEQLTGERIGAALLGNSLVTAEDEVPPLVLFFGPDGDLRGLRSNNYKDRGTWSVEDDSVCGAWNNWYGTMSRCWHVYRAGNRFTLKRQDGSTSVVATFKAGDVAGLQ